MTPEVAVTPEVAMTPEVAVTPVTPEEAAFNDIVSAGPSPVQQPEPEPTPPLSVSFAPTASPELMAAIKNVDMALEEVANFKDPSDVKGLRSIKGNVFTQLANTALIPQSSSQEETTAVIKRVSDAGLMGDMITIGPNWLKHPKRTEGFFGVGKLVQVNDRWILKWNGSDLQLQNVDATNFSKGDVDVCLIGKIVDASPPAIIRVVYMTEQEAK